MVPLRAALYGVEVCNCTAHISQGTSSPPTPTSETDGGLARVQSTSARAMVVLLGGKGGPSALYP